MEDSTAKTIDYLRARLLAERSVSRTARQRAYELGKRVTELEKQLKYVSLQRKKAEKATVEVLAILESHGRNDLSEPFDSSSDQEEMSSDFKDGNHADTSEHVNVRESDAEAFSGSEVESSSVNGRSLSWKSSKNSSSHFLDKKYMDASRRRRNSFTSTGSSPRRVGKSCRQIRHNKHRSANGGSQNGNGTNAHDEDQRRTSSEGVRNPSDVANETALEELNIQKEKDPREVATPQCNGHGEQNYATEREMEKALEHQAEFIARYEEEEKAQREWEDKYREKNGSPQDSCDPGTHSDLTEEIDEIKTPTLAPNPPCAIEQLTIEKECDANFIEDTTINVEPLVSQKNSDLNNEGSDIQKHPSDAIRISRAAQVSSSEDSSLLYRGEHASGNSNEPILGTHEHPGQLGSVLEALQLAKLSLKQNLDKLPLLENGPSVPTYRSEDQSPVPFSSVGLFRLPTDYEYGGTTPQAKSLTYDSRLSLVNYDTDPSGAQFISSPYRESLSRSATSLDDRFRMVPTFPYQENMSEIPRLPPSTFNPRFDMQQSALSLHPSTLDPRQSMHPSVIDSRLSVNPSARDLRMDVGISQSAFDQRLSVGPSVDPRLGTRSSSLDQRLGVGLSAIDSRSSVGPSVDTRLSMGRAALDTRSGLGAGQSSFDPRLDTGPQFSGNRYMSPDLPHSGAGLPPSSRYGTLSNGNIPLRTRSVYDSYARPDTYQ
uniref:uncharacterized protein LOC122589473 n=1 Tax=Erigeron canadensis TaxID=72917 RepID=UPI001CB93634|nr:uncharacterized protein LOC122589473 [Erigeron canadensis]XP_043617700.1 uncharacterized protein LOC122589473 [Erigeron canadensis]XP_043617701.1 uncharacterized protein LOC122589473 [Erigeron canadensis]